MRVLLFGLIVLLSLRVSAKIDHGGFCHVTLSEFSELALEYGPRTGKDPYLSMIKFVTIINKASRICELIKISAKSKEIQLQEFVRSKIDLQVKEFRGLVRRENKKINKPKPRFKKTSVDWLQRYMRISEQSIRKINNSDLKKPTK